MTVELRCSRVLHMTAHGAVVERLCRNCSYRTATQRVTVYHRWRFRRGRWVRTKDRTRTREVSVVE